MKVERKKGNEKERKWERNEGVLVKERKTEKWKKNERKSRKKKFKLIKKLQRK